MAYSKISFTQFLIVFIIINPGHSMKNSEYATLGGGCFWCIEAVYQRIDGILSVVPGYAGGHSKTTTYKEKQVIPGSPQYGRKVTTTTKPKNCY